MTFTLTLRIACSRLLNRLGFASLLVDPTGDDNSVLYTAKVAGAGGEDISVEYAAVATSAETTVAVVADAITVTPGSTARMVIGGLDLTSDGSTPVTFDPMLYAGVAYTKAAFTPDGSAINLAGDELHWVNLLNKWQIRKNGIVLFQSSDAVATPDLVTTWTPDGAATGTPTVTAGISSAAQVIAAVNAYPAAAALVTASESGAATGPVAAVAAAFLIYPEVLTLAALDLTLAGIDLTID